MTQNYQETLIGRVSINSIDIHGNINNSIHRFKRLSFVFMLNGHSVSILFILTQWVGRNIQDNN